MKYRNQKTGAVIETESKLGGSWMPVEPPAKETKTAKKKGTAKK